MDSSTNGHVTTWKCAFNWYSMQGYKVSNKCSFLEEVDFTGILVPDVLMINFIFEVLHEMGSISQRS